MNRKAPDLYILLPWGQSQPSTFVHHCQNQMMGCIPGFLDIFAWLIQASKTQKQRNDPHIILQIQHCLNINSRIMLWADGVCKFILDFDWNENLNLMLDILKSILMPDPPFLSVCSIWVENITATPRTSPALWHRSQWQVHSWPGPSWPPWNQVHTNLRDAESFIRRERHPTLTLDFFSVDIGVIIWCLAPAREPGGRAEGPPGFCVHATWTGPPAEHQRWRIPRGQQWRER